MRSYLSVFSLYIKSAFTKIIAVILLMTVTQLGLFIHILNSDKVLVTNFVSEKMMLGGLEKILLNSRMMSFIFALAFILITVILAIDGCKFNSREDFTLRRLNITEKKTILCKGFYGIFAYSLLVMAEALVLFGISLIYVKFAEGHPDSFEGLLSNQTVFLAFYRSNLLHSVLPLEDYLKYISTFIGIIGISFSTASLSFFLRRKKLFLETFILVPVIIINFTSTWTAGFAADLFIIGISGFILGVLITRISAEEQAYDN